MDQFVQNALSSAAYALIGVVIAALGRHVGVGDAGRHFERQPLADAGVERGRTQRRYRLRAVHHKNSFKTLASAIG